MDPKEIFTEDFLKELFPPERTDQFFEALYGGAEAGAFDIGLAFQGMDEGRGELHLEFRLTERPGMCMACSLTYGLPPVFERHPVIDLKGMVERIAGKLEGGWQVDGYRLGATRPVAPKTNSIPLTISLKRA